MSNVFTGEVPPLPAGMDWPTVAAWYDELIESIGIDPTVENIIRSVPALAAMHAGLKVSRLRPTSSDPSHPDAYADLVGLERETVLRSLPPEPPVRKPPSWELR